MTPMDDLRTRSGKVQIITQVQVASLAVKEGNAKPTPADWIRYTEDALRSWDKLVASLPRRTEDDIADEVITSLRKGPMWGKILREGTS